MKYKAVIFDLDGTLLDTLADIRSSLNQSLRRFGLREQTPEEVRAHVGNGSGRLVELSIPDGHENPVYDALLADYGAWYEAHCRVETRPYPGVVGLMRRLGEAGAFCAVVSNKPDAAVKTLCAEFFAGLAADAVGERPGIRRKPAPDTVLAALEELGTDRSDAVYVGDSEVDIMTARSAGIPCISVTWGFRTYRQLAEAGGEAFAADADELMALLQ